tara:strand:- start:4237 stop:5343 length:1107 start_codon:yes stop_codon:yes gene_type:complete
MFFYDIPNLLAIIIVVSVSFRIGLIPLWLSFFLILFSFTPFFLNDVLFPAAYMPDQFQYFEATQRLRDFNFEPIDNNNLKINVSNWLLATIPLPYIETIKSLGFFNRLIATILIIWLYSSKNLRGWPLLLILFYPSFLLYSSLALRDTLVLVFMIFAVILYIEKRMLMALLVSLPLAIIKFQNFFLVITYFVIHSYFTKGSLIYKYRYILLVMILAVLVPFILTIIEYVDYYRYALFIEDGGRSSSYVQIKTFGEFTVAALQSAPYFLMKPLPWEADSFLQIIQSFENFLILIFLIFIFLKAYKVDKSIALKWFVYLLAAFSIYGLVIYNFGTAVRYKFPFIMIIVIGIAYELYSKYDHLILNKSKRI